MKEKLNPGDIFYLKLEDFDKYIFGRVLFDVEQQYLNKNDTQNEEAYFDVYEDCQLLEMYTGIYNSISMPDTLNILIQGVFIYRIDSKNNRLKWGKVGYNKVDYETLEFPEILANSLGCVKLLRGELSFETKYEDADEFEIDWSAEFPEVLANECAYLQNQHDLINGEHYSESFKRMDLRNFPELRNKVYADLGLDPKKSYYELSKEVGFDLARFY
ncbi:hypothetical protein [Pedobacter jeongneungensis]|uniref:hypothetical protein n=1 Tax=Pedobacter jeongneungensis TaxID=947309 RepID=UPI0004688A76|nr:hypothetical protein [Pedobacter jeongneungensis]